MNRKLEKPGKFEKPENFGKPKKLNPEMINNLMEEISHSTSRLIETYTELFEQIRVMRQDIEKENENLIYKNFTV